MSVAWIVLAHDSDQKVQAFGPFDLEDTAVKWAAIQERKWPRLDWLPLPICDKNAAVRKLLP